MANKYSTILYNISVKNKKVQSELLHRKKHARVCYISMTAVIEMWELATRSNLLLFLYRSNRSQMFDKINVFRNFTKFSGKHLCWSLRLADLQLY